MENDDNLEVIKNKKKLIFARRILLYSALALSLVFVIHTIVNCIIAFKCTTCSAHWSSAIAINFSSYFLPLAILYVFYFYFKSKSKD